MCAAQPYDVEIGEGNRLTERVLPAVLEIIERGDFTGPVMRKVASECRMSLTDPSRSSRARTGCCSRLPCTCRARRWKR